MTVNPETAVERAQPRSLALQPISDPRGALARLKELQAFVQEVFLEGEDYGRIPGIAKPSLFKPGAEKLCELYGLAAEYDASNRIEEWERGFWHYEVRCSLRSRASGDVVGQGLGSCNSMEERYRWREARRTCPACGQPAIIVGRPEFGGGFVCFKRQGGCGAKYREDDPIITAQPIGRVENESRWDLPNTLLKMAKKRALVDAALSVTRSSGLFTQDVEDLAAGAVDARAVVAEVSRPAPRVPDPDATISVDDFVESYRQAVTFDDLNRLGRQLSGAALRRLSEPDQQALRQAREAAVARIKDGDEEAPS